MLAQITDKSLLRKCDLNAQIFDNKAHALFVRVLMLEREIDIEGVRLVVEDLGVEVAFSQERFVSDLREHILRAF